MGLAMLGIPRLMIFLLLAAAVGGCASFGDKHDADVGIGTAAYERKAAQPYAALYLPYARMAALTRSVNEEAGCPRADQFAPALKEDGPREWANALGRRGWHCKWAKRNFRVCPPGRQCMVGLGFHVWFRGCREVAIVYRGTDFGVPGQIGDILSSLRWFVHPAAVDEYGQVGYALPTILERIRKKCP